MILFFFTLDDAEHELSTWGMGRGSGGKWMEMHLSALVLKVVVIKLGN